MTPTTGPGTPGHLDANAAAGPLREIFARDLTAAVARCAGCDRSAALGQAHMYGPEPGIVLRCTGCQGVLLRLVVSGDRAWLDMRGVASLQIALQP